MKIFIAKTFLKIGDLEYNYKKILEIYDQSLSDGCDLIIFPQMTITGFPIRDEIEQKDFIDKSNDFLEKIIDYTKDKKTRILLGCPYFVDEINDENNIKKSELFNSVILINDGYINAVSNKTNIAKHNLFDEYRYFDKETILKSITYENDNFDVLIGDDIMENKNIFFIKERDTDFIICLDTEIQQNIEKKKKQIIKIAKWTNKNVIYVNTLGYDFNNEYRFNGEIFVIDIMGNIEYCNKTINENIIKLNSMIDEGKIRIIESKDNIDGKNENFVNLLANTYSNELIVCEAKNKNIKNIVKNVKLITFDKNNIDKNIEFIDTNNYIKNLTINDELKKIIIKNIYKNCIFLKF